MSHHALMLSSHVCPIATNMCAAQQCAVQHCHEVVFLCPNRQHGRMDVQNIHVALRGVRWSLWIYSQPQRPCLQRRQLCLSEVPRRSLRKQGQKPGVNVLQRIVQHIVPH